METRFMDIAVGQSCTPFHVEKIALFSIDAKVPETSAHRLQLRGGMSAIGEDRQ